MKLLSKIFATFFGVGYFPIAPGTLTSLLVILLYKFYLHKLSWPYYLVILSFLFLVGTFVSTKYSLELNKKDPRTIVIDEALGQLLVLFRLNPTWFPLLIGFGLFRFFDIIKPFPIKKTEEFPKGWGIMIDDILAAIYAGISLNLYLYLK